MYCKISCLVICNPKVVFWNCSYCNWLVSQLLSWRLAIYLKRKLVSCARHLWTWLCFELGHHVDSAFVLIAHIDSDIELCISCVLCLFWIKYIILTHSCVIVFFCHVSEWPGTALSTDGVFCQKPFCRTLFDSPSAYSAGLMCQGCRVFWCSIL